MIKKFLVLLSFVIVAFSGFSHGVDPSTAAQTGMNYWAFKSGFKGTPVVTNSYTIADQGAPVYYVFDINNNGFVIVAAEDAVSPILGYSFEGTYQNENQAPAFVYWMNQYKQVILNARAANLQASQQVQNTWTLFSQPVSQELKAGSKSVLPLVTTRWDQIKYYNYYCPAHTAGPDGHCVTGCVATAMAQVMKYWDYPVTGVGTHSYEHPFYGTISADFSTGNYDWTHMTTAGSSTSKEAISKLIYHCGVSVDMNYSPLESGSFTELAVDALKNYFGYRKTIKILDYSDYTMLEWRNIIMENLENGMPMIYSGSGSAGGHAWVCDGYQDTSNFHMNWGWGGLNNGYFDLANLTEFPNGHQIVVNIIPTFEYYCLANKVMDETTFTFGDGSGYSYYWNDTDCDWLIQPANATSITLNFTQFNTEEGKDTVNVYDGATTAAPLLGSYSGINMPPALTSTGGSMLITFNSDASNQGQGWEAIYVATVPAGTGTEDLSASTAIYPNPAREVLNIVFGNPLEEQVALNIYNITGQLVKSEMLEQSAEKAVIDLKSLPQGVYMLSISGQKNHFCKSFVIE